MNTYVHCRYLDNIYIIQRLTYLCCPSAFIYVSIVTDGDTSCCCCPSFLLTQSPDDILARGVTSHPAVSRCPLPHSFPLPRPLLCTEGTPVVFVTAAVSRLETVSFYPAPTHIPCAGTQL